ncbi:MAG: hypothetical protein R2682_00240 [Pyrinomonadaceae bacterium]
MKRNTERAVMLLLIGAFAMSFVFGQTRQSPLLSRNVEISPLFHANIWSAVHVLADQDIPIGFESREHGDVDNDKRLFLKSGKLEDVLNSIVKQDTYYTWSEVDGVINFYPATDRDARFEHLLFTRLGPLTVCGGEHRASLVKSVDRLINKSNVRFFSVIGEGNSLGLPDKVSTRIEIPNSDLRSVLNKLIRTQAYQPIWTVSKGIDPGEIVVSF